MSEQQTPDSQSAPVLQMSDDLISMIRELIQLSLLTGTNIIDHLRAIQIEKTPNNKLTVTMEYVEAYNQMVTKLNDEVLKQQAEMQQTPAIED
jgi:hypothetical protein